jgi:hypothetical protein
MQRWSQTSALNKAITKTSLRCFRLDRSTHFAIPPFVVAAFNHDFVSSLIETWEHEKRDDIQIDSS